jgi:hypothetical protein
MDQCNRQDYPWCQIGSKELTDEVARIYVHRLVVARMEDLRCSDIALFLMFLISERSL